MPWAALIPMPTIAHTPTYASYRDREEEDRQSSTEEQRSLARCSATRMQQDFHRGLLGRSYGAPVPDEPMNSVWPDGSVRSRPLARRVPSFEA